MAKRIAKGPLAFCDVRPSNCCPQLFEQITDLLAECLVQDIHSSRAPSMQTLTGHEVTRILTPSLQ